MEIKIPNNPTVSSSGITWLDDSGILIAIGKDHAIHTIDHARENHKVCMELAKGIKRPILIDMTEVKSMTQEARTFYAGEEPASILSAVAILTTSQIGNMVGNAFMTLTKPVLPTKMFMEYSKARKWVMKFL